MLFLIALLLACVFAWFCAKPLKKHPVLFYILACMITVIMFLIGKLHLAQISPILNQYGVALFTHGALAGALWCVVAWTGALPNGSTAMKKLMPIRGELSIFTALITLSHAVTYGITYLQRIFSGRPITELDFWLTSIISLLLMLIMIPLTVISFKKIRKQMNAKRWKKIQRVAYVFYALIYLHVLIIFIPRAKLGREGVLFSLLIYTAVFVGYAMMRIRKYLLLKKKEISPQAVNGVCVACLAISFGGVMITAQPSQIARSAEESPITQVSTTEIESISETPLTETENLTESLVMPTEESQITIETETILEESTQADSETSTPENTAPTQTETAIISETIPETTIIQEIPEEIQQAEQVSEENPVEFASPEPEAIAEPEPVLQYRSGTYHVELFGYDANEYFDITIENDQITAINGSCDESDTWYFESALPVIRDAIINANSPDVPDAVSGATISSDCIKQAVRQALEQARN